MNTPGASKTLSLSKLTASQLAGLWDSGRRQGASQEKKSVHFYHPHRLTKAPLVDSLRQHQQAGLQVVGEWGELLVVQTAHHATPPPCYWAQNVWRDVQLLSINSVKDAAQKLKSLHHLWCPYTVVHHRRTTLIQDQLFSKWDRRLPPPPNDGSKYSHAAAKFGCYSLIAPNLIVLSADCREPVPHGSYEFQENKEDPPNRAYLKLWEAFTRLGVTPKAKESCLELGASPGGWTWVLAEQLRSTVTAIDRSPLTASLMSHPNVRFIQGDAFDISHHISRHAPHHNLTGSPNASNALSPPTDWLFSDVICYPEKLFSYVQTCLQRNLAKNYICTIKFQGTDQYHWIEKFATIEGSHIVHLYHNKHELTWIKLQDSSPGEQTS